MCPGIMPSTSDHEGTSTPRHEPAAGGASLNAEPPSKSDGAFYVGYLPLPASLHTATRLIAAAFLLALVLAAGIIAAAQRSPGSGHWDLATMPPDGESPPRGILLTHPYPMLIAIDGRDDAAAVLLVESGKFGAQRRLGEEWHGRYVQVNGTRIERNGRRMIELFPGDDAVLEMPEIDPRRQAPTNAGNGEGSAIMSGMPPAFITRIPAATDPLVTLEGEILDSKCHLGAMKPGDGKAHKACATLCISGGIAPLLITTNRAGEPADLISAASAGNAADLPRYLLIVTHDGAAARDLVLPDIGEPVALTGRLGRIADLEVIYLSSEHPIRRR